MRENMRGGKGVFEMINVSHVPPYCMSYVFAQC